MEQEVCKLHQIRANAVVSALLVTLFLSTLPLIAQVSQFVRVCEHTSWSDVRGVNSVAVGREGRPSAVDGGQSTGFTRV